MKTIINFTGIGCITLLALGLYYLYLVPASDTHTVKGLAYAISGIALAPVWIALSGRLRRIRKDGLKEEAKSFTREQLNTFKRQRMMLAGYGMSACCNVPIIQGRCTACANPDPFYEQD